MAKGKYEYWISDDGRRRLEAYARDGLTDKQIANNIGIAVSTLNNWKNDHVEILESLKRGKEVVDIEVENALLKRALGYKYKETTKELFVDKNNGTEELKVTKVVEKEVVPDTTAQIFWLKNRKPEEWRDKRQVDVDNKKTNSDIIKNMKVLADLILNPLEDRDISDFE
ncbi:helix-turn-helix domain-containing protein [Lachnospiraceae bacterium LCP25S3_G4]